MTGFVWYSPEINVVVIQWFAEGCAVSFEWGNGELYERINKLGPYQEPMESTLWFPLGML